MAIIEFFQQFDFPAIYMVMRFLSFLGDEPFYFLVLPVLFWCWDKKKAFPLAIILSLEFFLNFMLKDAFHISRPEGIALINVDGFSFPSGHAQNAVVLFGYLAWVTRKNFWLAGVLIFLIGLSRLYLGVHFPSDIVGGWALGFVWLFICLYVLDQLEKRRFSMPMVPAIGLIFLLSLWLLSLYTHDISIKISGAAFGFLAGALVERTSIRYICQASLLRQGIKILLGAVGVVIIKEGLDLFLPNIPTLHYVRYACAGGWIGLGAPWVFIKFGLGNAEVTRDEGIQDNGMAKG